MLGERRNRRLRWDRKCRLVGMQQLLDGGAHQAFLLAMKFFALLKFQPRRWLGLSLPCWENAPLGRHQPVMLLQALARLEAGGEINLRLLQLFSPA